MATSVHLGAGALAALTTAWMLLRRPFPKDSTAYLVWAAAGTIPWALSVASVKASGLHPWHQVLWLPAIAFSAGAYLLWAGGFSQYGWRPSRALVAMWLGTPALMLAVRVIGGMDTRDGLFIANTVYSFGVLVVATAWISQRADDPEPVVRMLAWGLLAVGIGVLITEAFRANVTDLVAAVVVTAVGGVTAYAGDRLRSRPRPDILIDDLGALLFVFDAEQRLVDLNAPARLFYTLRDAEPPAPGSLGSELLGADLARLDTVTVALSAGDSTIRFSGYVQRLPSHGTPSRGWVCLLRRSVDRSPADGSRDARRAVMSRLPAYDPATRLLSARAFEQALASASAYPEADSIPATALVLEADDPSTLGQAARVVADSWEHRLETIAVGRYGELQIALVVRDVTEHNLRAWFEQTLGRHRVRSGTRSGPVARAPELVEDAFGELDPV